MGLSVILILVTMVLQLNSFRKSLLVLVVIPLAVAGVFINFTILGIPLSFAALIGVLGLFGIVVNNSIMLLEKINQNIKFGLPFVDAIASACSSRVEAIFFTSLTTAMGLLPITISDPFWRGLGGAIIAGLSVSGIFILFLLPALYYEMYQGSDENKSILKNKYTFKNNKNKSTQK
jgi:multidrug efflux pump subunit AcrB